MSIYSFIYKEHIQGTNVSILHDFVSIKLIQHVMLTTIVTKTL